MPPRAILFDMDDTLISAYNGNPRDVWRRTLEEFDGTLAGMDLDKTADAIHSAAQDFWSDASRHKAARLNLAQARYDITGTGLRSIGVLDETVARQVADAFHDLRNREMKLFPHAHTTLDKLRAAGVRLLLITNGESEIQREKIRRFEFEHRFDHIQVEGEVGFGKPEPEAYFHALRTIGAAEHETWIVGDNLEWEVAAPKRLGIHTVWHDHAGTGLPDNAPAQPDRIITRLDELMDGF